MPIDRTGPDLADAARHLQNGGLVAFPTETVYGLGADATDPAAVARIYAAKGRPSFNPLIGHVANREAAGREGRFDHDAERLAEAFWPGPLTLVVPRAPGGRICDLACAGLPTVGLRVPAHPLAAALLAAVDRPVAAPSANRSGRLSPTVAADVAADLANADLAGADLLVLDGGPCRVGVESTIIGCGHAGPRLLRPGGIPPEAIAAVLGRALAPVPLPLSPGQADDTVVAPGMTRSHYAPRASLRLDARDLRPGEAGLDFAGQLAAGALDLSIGGNLVEAAANLFGHLRRLDRTGAAMIAVAPIPHNGLGLAINDRLRRGAAPRP